MEIAARNNNNGITEIRRTDGSVEKERVPGYIEKYSQLGYTVHDQCAPVVQNANVKDYNEYLQYLKKMDPSAIAALGYNNNRRKCR